jgi:hypothetical protein
MKTSYKEKPKDSEKDMVRQLRAIDLEGAASPTLDPKEQDAVDWTIQGHDLSGPMCDFLMRSDISIPAKVCGLVDEARRKLRLASIVVDQGTEDAKIGDIELMAVADALHEVDSLLGASDELADRTGLL